MLISFDPLRTALRRFVCRFRGHLWSDWFQERYRVWTAGTGWLAGSTGEQTWSEPGRGRHCRRCGEWQVDTPTLPSTA